MMEKMKEIREILEQIHLLQTRLGSLHSRLRRGPALLKSQEANIQKLTDVCSQIQEQHRTLHADAKRKELEVLARDQALAKRKSQLQESKTNKEYQALQLQIQADEAARSVLDDEALEAIEKAEQFAEKIPAAEADIQKARETFETSRQRFAAEKPEIESEIAELSKRLESEEAKLPREFREVYNRLVRSVGGSEALAVVEQQKFCGGCNHQIPINSLAQILAKKPVTCSSCSKLLYVPADFVFDKG
jgi:predicted  nucleic acid-binding Zn-ribbon protein